MLGAGIRKMHAQQSNVEILLNSSAYVRATQLCKEKFLMTVK